MIRRKLVSLLLATTMIAGVVTGCGEKEEGSADGKGSVYYLSFKPTQTVTRSKRLWRLSANGCG